jgi:predicted dehydrogenase
MSGKGMSAACRVAVIGAGYMAKEHIRAFQDIPGVAVVGIQSRTRSRAEGLANELQVGDVYDSIGDLYRGTGADLVVVTTPELETNRVCRECFEYPWTALIEKPAGYDVADAEDIARAADAKQRRAFVALNRRHYSSTRAVIDDLASQEGPRLIVVRDQQDPVGALAAGQPPLVVKNWMFANSVHVIDYFTVLGRGRVTGVENVIPWTPAAPRYVAAKVQFDSGDVGLYEAIWDGPGPWAVTVNTPQKRWELRPLEKAAFQARGTRALVPVDIDPIDDRFKAGLRHQAALAVAAAAGDSTPLPTLADALVSMRLVQSIYRTDDSRRGANR